MNGQFYSHGFSTLKIDKSQADHLLKLIKNEIFLPVSDIFDVYAKKTVDTCSGAVTEPDFNIKVKRALNEDWHGIKHPDIWKKGVNGDNGDSLSVFSDYPEGILDFWKDFSKNHLSWFSKTWGPFDHFGILAHAYHPGQALGFHHDLSDSTELNCIAYLGSNDFTEDDGGFLEIAECDIDFDGMPILASIKPIKMILPNHGTVVVLDNTNPRILHRVKPLLGKKERFTLSCQFGRLSNILRKKTNKK
jgi:hypothetical protein